MTDVTEVTQPTEEKEGISWDSKPEDALPEKVVAEGEMAKDATPELAEAKIAKDDAVVQEASPKDTPCEHLGNLVIDDAKSEDDTDSGNGLFAQATITKNGKKVYLRPDESSISVEAPSIALSAPGVKVGSRSRNPSVEDKGPWNTPENEVEVNCRNEYREQIKSVEGRCPESLFPTTRRVLVASLAKDKSKKICLTSRQQADGIKRLESLLDGTLSRLATEIRVSANVLEHFGFDKATAPAEEFHAQTRFLLGAASDIVGQLKHLEQKASLYVRQNQDGKRVKKNRTRKQRPQKTEAEAENISEVKDTPETETN